MLNNLQILIVLFLASIISSNVQAQFELGVFTGVNVNQVSASNNAPSGIESTTDYLFGISPGYRFAEKYKVLADIKLMRKGFDSRNRISGLSQFENYNYRNLYLEFSEQFEFRPIKTIGLSVGGYIAVKLEETQKTGELERVETSEIGFFKNSDTGLTFGLRTYLKQFTLFALYNHGLKDISNIIVTDETGNPVGNLELKNRTIQLGLGYVFQFKKSVTNG